MSSAPFDLKALREACRSLEAKHGIEAFLDAMAENHAGPPWRPRLEHRIL
jgi:hypothetical protein